jgi:hypothetical protein
MLTLDPFQGGVLRCVVDSCLPKSSATTYDPLVDDRILSVSYRLLAARFRCQYRSLHRISTLRTAPVAHMDGAGEPM